MFYEQKQDRKKYKFVVDNRLKFKGQPIFGETDDKKRIIKINKKLSKKKTKKKLNAHKYPELADTIYHENLHAKHPKMTEKIAYKKTHKAIKKMDKKGKQKLYNQFKGK